MVRCILRVLHTVETLKYTFEMFSRKSNTFIGHADMQLDLIGF